MFTIKKPFGYVTLFFALILSSCNILPTSSDAQSSGSNASLTPSETPSSEDSATSAGSETTVISEIPITSSTSEPEPSSEEIPMDNKVLNNLLFANPSRADRPMVMMHNSTNAAVNDAFDRGYGGIVTNVAWGNDYLQNSRAFANLRSVIDHTINTKGMYVWLYDELGYPSGAAFGQTLKNNPEFEALGLVSEVHVVTPNEQVTVNLIYGHERIVEAYVYEGTNESSMNLTTGTSVSHLINEAGNTLIYKNETPTNRVLISFTSKRWYENTHSMENWYAQQRYINMLEPGPASKFINITYDKYYEHLSEYFGNGIKAFFTDEPAHQGNYFDITDRPRTVIDVPDLNIPIIPALNYANSLFDVFSARYGYDLRPYLSYLYKEDNSVIAKQIRMDFYALTSELFRENYLEQISDWSDAHNVKSSGHLLLEENLFQNPWFAGNMIQLLGTMGIPGTDLLFSRPARAMKDSSIVSRMASSAADFLNKKDTFAEVSGAFDGTRGDVYEQANAIGVQVAMGINNFASYYYQGGDHTVEQDLFFSAALGRMRYMVTDSVHRANVALYYPYEGVSAVTLPTTNLNVASEEAQIMSDEFRDIANTLVEKQIDYDLFDHQNFKELVVRDGALVAPNGERFTSVIVPYTAALYASTILKLKEAQDGGVTIIIQDFDNVVTERGQNSVATLFTSIVNEATNLRTSVAIANFIRQNNLNSFRISDAYANDIYMSKRENLNYLIYPTVNAHKNNSKQLTFTLDGHGQAVKYYNAFTGEISDIDATFNDDQITFTFRLPANTTGFIVVEK